MNKAMVLLATLSLAGGLFGSASGTVNHVPDDFASIGQAVDGSSAGDTVLVAPGVYTGLYNRNMLVWKPLVILGSGPEVTEIALDMNSGFYINGYLGGPVRIEGFTMTEGSWQGGWVAGAVAVDSTSAGTTEIVNCVFRACGPGVQAIHAPVSLSDCFFDSCSSCIRTSYGALLNLENCDFKKSFGTQFSALWLTDSDVNATNCVIQSSVGSAMHIRGSTAELTHFLISGNAKYGIFGGAGMVVYENSNVRLIESTVTGNYSWWANGPVGGIRLGYDTLDTNELYLERSIVYGNCAGLAAGGDEIGAIGDYIIETVGDCSIADTTEVIDLTSGLPIRGLGFNHVDPLFCDPAECMSAPTAAGDYSVEEGSPPATLCPGQTVGWGGVGCLITDVDDGSSVPTVPFPIEIRPNPLNPSTEIRFTLAEPDRVRLDVYDTAGRLVRSLLNRSAETDLVSVRWDGMVENGRPAPSGIYFAVLRTEKQGEFSAKMILLR